MDGWMEGMDGWRGCVEVCEERCRRCHASFACFHCKATHSRERKAEELSARRSLGGDVWGQGVYV
jgi:hypothetical protein